MLQEGYLKSGFRKKNAAPFFRASVFLLPQAVSSQSPGSGGKNKKSKTRTDTRTNAGCSPVVVPPDQIEPPLANAVPDVAHRAVEQEACHGGPQHAPPFEL